MCFEEPDLNTMTSKRINYLSWEIRKWTYNFLIMHKFQTFHQSQIMLMLVKPTIGIDSGTC